MRKTLLWIAVCQLTVSAQVFAQSPNQLMSSTKARRALDYLKASEPETIGEQVRTCEIAAPPFKEQERASYYKQRFTTLGLKNVHIDREGNVIGERPGVNSAPTLVLAAHLDTVFPEGTDVRVKKEGAVLKGPGIADDCRGLAVILAVARSLNEAEIETRGTIIFVADVGEEGVGNLRGMRYLLTEELKGRVTHLISVDLSGFDVINREIGSNRYRITYRGAGGHSYADFGMPSPIHALGRAIERISRFKVPQQPKTTFNVGRIEGGASVNAIAQTAWMEVDMRSESAAELAKVDAEFKRAVQSALDEENAFWANDKKLAVEMKLIGERPVGKQAPDAPIVQTVLAVDTALGVKSNLVSGSSDSGMPMRFGIPAATVGAGGRAQGMHSVNEIFDTTDSYLGAQRALLIALAIVGLR
jgi:tripeptide aminopeptidase